MVKKPAPVPPKRPMTDGRFHGIMAGKRFQSHYDKQDAEKSPELRDAEARLAKAVDLSSLMPLGAVGSDNKLALEFFSGDDARASRLHEIFKDVRRAIDIALRRQSLDPVEREQVIQAVIHSLAENTPAKVPFPRKAPALWTDRDPNQKITPAEFTRNIYRRWIGNGLTRRHLRELDESLYHALSVWEHRHPDDTIQELPTLAQVIDQKIERLSAEFTPEDLRKLGTTLQTRLRREKK